ncbi:MAG TPA: DUF885 domain-containing protein [Acidimicrobiales bacterium]|nr:DUF885 domain-containing protein [Acidimicrobiales bacterium]
MAPDSFDSMVALWLGEFFEEHPSAASFFGVTDYDGRLEDATAQGFERREASARMWLDRFNGVDRTTLTPAEQVDLALLQAGLGERVATADFATWRRDARVYLDNGVFELFMHGNRPEADAVAAAKERLLQVPGMLQAGWANLQPELADPELVRQWAIPNVSAQATFMREGLGELVQHPALRAELEAAGAQAAMAYDGFAEQLTEFANRANGQFMFGEERYDAVLQIGEGFAFTARELRDMGRQQVELLSTQMSELAQRIDGTPEWTSVIDRLRGEHPADMDALLRCYREETARAREFVRSRGLMTLPEGEECAVEPAPLFLRAAAPVASYFPPAAFGPASSGTFNVPFTPDGASADEREARLRSNSYCEIPGVTAHEAYPGHHLHFAAAQGSSALRQVVTSTYMVEGWGLYVEQMMGEQGFYLTPEAQLGQLSMRLFRAGRIVVDTSLHLGDMSMDEAITYMSERCGFPRPTARGEVLRYCSTPTQASAYLTGALEIARMAEAWTGGGMGSLAQFHDALTTSGKLPLGVAAQAIGLVPLAR